MIICLKSISEESFLFNGNLKIIDACLKFFIKVPTQEAKLYKNFYTNQIPQTHFKSFSNQRSDTASLPHSGTGRVFKDTQGLIYTLIVAARTFDYS